MKKLNIIFIILPLLIFVNMAYGAEIVYPKSDNVKINSATTFFIGNEKSSDKLTINGEDVNIHATGAFYHPVNLNVGKNIFKIENGNHSETKVYTIIRPPVKQKGNDCYKMYKTDAVYVTKTDNSPLRATPNDDGHNRLQDLQKNIPLNIIGEEGNFYKIKLARDDYAWIGKNLAIISDDTDFSNAKIESYTYSENTQKRVFTIKLNKKAPYILSEARGYNLINNKYEAYSNGLDLVIYNVADQPENKYELHIDNQKANLYGYKSYYNDANELVIEVKNQPKVSKSYPLKGITVTLDPGHGGSEYGAIGCLGDKEKDINLAIALKTKDKLEKEGAKVFITRDNDVDLHLYDRVKFSQKNNTDIFVSIHANALPDSLANSNKSGTSVYYFYPQANNLARTIQETMVKDLAMNDDKVHQESFAVIRNTDSLSILIEVGYMIIPEDNAKLTDSNFQDKAARSIVRGLEKYFYDIQQ